VTDGGEEDLDPHLHVLWGIYTYIFHHKRLSRAMYNSSFTTTAMGKQTLLVDCRQEKHACRPPYVYIYIYTAEKTSYPCKR
jgi:hypothetical protein